MAAPPPPNPLHDPVGDDGPARTAAINLPVNPAQRADFTIDTSPGVPTFCQLFYTDPTAPAVPPATERTPIGSKAVNLSRFNTILAQQTKQKTGGNGNGTGTGSGNGNGAGSGGGDPPNFDPATLPLPHLITSHGRPRGADFLNSVGNFPLTQFCRGYARHMPCLQFEGPNSLVQRVSLYRSLQSQYPSCTNLGGRSQGSRAAIRASLYSPIQRLIFFTYPLSKDLELRDEEFLRLDENVEVLFLVGDRDEYAILSVLEGVRNRMKAKSWHARIRQGNHALSFEGNDQARERVCNVAGQIAGRWALGLNRHPEYTDCELSWNGKTGLVEWTQWAPKASLGLTPHPVKRIDILIDGGPAVAFQI